MNLVTNGLPQIEKLFDVACSLTDVLSLLPSPNDPFVLGPRDYLTQFLTLLSTLRNGDSRFLPLLLSKVHDVLPRLASPMLQTVPDTPESKYGLDPNLDIFDGFGNAGMGVASSLPVHFDTKRIEEIGPATNDSSQDTPSFTSPPIMPTGMEYPVLAEYGGFQNLSSTMTAPTGMAAQQRLPTQPMRQNSSGSVFSVMPRNVPDFHHLRREDSLEHGHPHHVHNGIPMGMDNLDMPYR
jgi:hypothetical protein